MHVEEIVRHHCSNASPGTPGQPSGSYDGEFVIQKKPKLKQGSLTRPRAWQCSSLLPSASRPAHGHLWAVTRGVVSLRNHAGTKNIKNQVCFGCLPKPPPKKMLGNEWMLRNVAVEGPLKISSSCPCFWRRVMRLSLYRRGSLAALLPAKSLPRCLPTSVPKKRSLQRGSSSQYLGRWERGGQRVSSVTNPT